MSEISEIYAEVMAWARRAGADEIYKQPGLWRGKTKSDGVIGPLDVKINPHKEQIEGVPPFCAWIGMEDRFPGVIGVIGPNDGWLMSSPVEGENEQGLIRHFRDSQREDAA